ncbi:hypothetical protein SSCG_05975 [Streptomyces clavuligerus]|nr:hypothetical protein SSCG_05975 [Streptomyces clavuligerus]
MVRCRLGRDVLTRRGEKPPARRIDAPRPLSQALLPCADRRPAAGERRVCPRSGARRRLRSAALPLSRVPRRGPSAVRRPPVSARTRAPAGAEGPHRPGPRAYGGTPAARVRAGTTTTRR